ncbi:hypothetical protein PUN28_020847 [Cardiocondyla obscurior]|uniref:Uncharacterized protein n=1 Tax=Cardiocondyla obscurior TaxID=286306 RepID=A0AAW2E779_9HYME
MCPRSTPASTSYPFRAFQNFSIISIERWLGNSYFPYDIWLPGFIAFACVTYSVGDVTKQKTKNKKQKTKKTKKQKNKKTKKQKTKKTKTKKQKAKKTKNKKNQRIKKMIKKKITIKQKN